MSSHESVALRVNLRIDLSEENGASEPALLMSASPERMLIRMTRARRPGEVLRLVAEPSFQDSFLFTVRVHSCMRRLVPTDHLDYFEIWADVLNPDETYRRFLSRVRKTARDLKEDVRLMLRAPLDLTRGEHRIRTHVENLSFGGIFLFADRQMGLRVGDSLQMSLHLPGEDAPFPLAGAVVYILTPDEAERIGARPGAGVRLTLDEEAAFRWEAAVQGLHRKVTE